MQESGLSREEVAEMTAADKAFMFDASTKHRADPNYREDDDDEDEPDDRDQINEEEYMGRAKDPYIKKKTEMVQQEYRKVNIGPTDLLKNG